MHVSDNRILLDMREQYHQSLDERASHAGRLKLGFESTLHARVSLFADSLRVAPDKSECTLTQGGAG
jgi:hypothetical protein